MEIMEALKVIVYVFVIISRLISSLLSSPSEYNNDNGLSEGQTFDFIVVGGGTAGCAIAARLAQSGTHTVLLLESGGMPNPNLDTPAISVQYTQDSPWAKTYQTVPQQRAGFAEKGVLKFSQGRGLGGSSAINGMVINWGSPNDYNNWAKLTGDPSWSYGSVLKYFRRFENYTGPHPSDQRGYGGPITVSRNKRYSPGSPEWLRGGQELGYPVAEPNAPQIISFTPLDFSKKNGRRVTSYKGYIEPMLEGTSIHTPSNPTRGGSSRGRKSNLLVLIDTLATQITFQGNRAVGIRFTSNSTSATYARARKELILSAGVYESPTLLMRSGIGPKPVLDSAGVKAIKHLPVGQNLHDHASVALAVVFGNRSAAYDPKTELNPTTWQEFLKTGDGPFFTYLGESNEAFIASSSLPPRERRLGWADIQLLPLHTNAAGVLGAGEKVSDLQDHEITVRWTTFAARPRSRGTVKLNSTDVNGDPLIDFQYLTNPYDLNVIVDGIKTYVRLCEETSAFKSIGCRIPTDVLPACSHLQFRSDEYWRCYARQVTSHGYHGVGTCRMGRGVGDPEAVVDTQLRVIGIRGLRVADASVMPAITNANTQAPVYVIAEKAADMILSQWGY